MARSADYYAPINQALQNMNAQLNENYRRQMDSRYQLAQTELAAAKLNSEILDPRVVLAKAEAADKLTPTKMNIKSFMPQGVSDKFTQEQWQKFVPHVGNIVGDMGATVNENGDIVGSDGIPMTQPKFKAQKLNNRITAAQQLMFDEDVIREGKIRTLDDKISGLKEEYKKSKLPALEMQIKGLSQQRDKMQAEYDNPNRRLLSLRRKMDNNDKLMMQAFTDQADPSFIEMLKWQQKRAQDEYNNILRATGRDGKAEGIQLKRYKNPVTGQVIDYPISKFEGARYTLTNPIAGNVRHNGTFVLDESGSGSDQDIVQRVRAAQNSYNDLGMKITNLKNSLYKGGRAKAMLEANGGKIDSELEGYLSNDLVDEKAVQTQIAELESTRKSIADDLRQYEKNPQVRVLLGDFFKQGGKKDDPLGLSNTNAGSRYSGVGLDPVLVE